MERAHRTLEQVIRCLLAERQLPQDRWSELLPLVELTCNTSVSDSTGKTPSELVFGTPL